MVNIHLICGVNPDAIASQIRIRKKMDIADLQYRFSAFFWQTDTYHLCTPADHLYFPDIQSSKENEEERFSDCIASICAGTCLL